MGRSGPGAPRAVKPPPKANGRPRTPIADAVYDALRAPTLRAIAVLDALLESPDERTQLLAAKALVELGSRPKPPVLPDPDVQPKPLEIVVAYENTRASTG